MDLRRLISSNIHHYTNITNMWQGQKSLFGFFWKTSLTCGAQMTLMKHECPEHKQWEGCLGLSVKDRIPIMLPPRHLLQCLSNTWPTDCCFASGTVMNLNGGTLLSQTCNSLAFREPAFFVGRKHLLSCKPHQNPMSSGCWILLTFVHWVPTDSDTVRFQSIAQSHNHYEG